MFHQNKDIDILDMIIKCETEYLKCFCKVDRYQDFIRFQDDYMPDYWSHNYTWVNKVKDDKAFIHLIESEITHSKNRGKDFCLIRCHFPLNNPALKQLPIEPDISTSIYLVLNDFSGLSNLNKIKDSRVDKVDKIEMLEDIISLDEAFGDSRDFCTRRVYRRKDIYLSSGGVDSYVCYHNNIAVGNCDLFIHGNMAKIEDFAVSPNHQRKGFGKAMMRVLLEIAKALSVTKVYLETDKDDTAKDMFQKCGFHKVNEFTDLTFYL